ncbi:HypC/HybG/HupF family hydrogenase formation chaperone [Actinomadura syzygii]|uniref:HypC/HybG/HupF family hydrogenase formation chaperone n=1 Tax=Actinomadura syzygii TaxID=1427538 RepID=A0A5D0UEA1_9ACTN|nr:HypC/HybG/HupF family hydrogenase formation chaperone [Actinomadura syzygii]TYC16397.1 HypC/HybG/HupF family hydrogenase formation chaperone [Actinomadura syzygii]
MCLGIPGRIVEADDSYPRMGVVDFDGVRREVCLAYTPEADVGDFVIVHVGFAISTVDEEEAARTLAVLNAIPDALNAELAGGDPSGRAG